MRGHGRCSGQENRESASSAGGRSRGKPRRQGGIGVLRIRLRYLNLKVRALCWVLRRLRAGLHSLARRQETGKLRRIQEIEMADGSLKLRALIWVLRRQRAVDYRSTGN